MKMKSYENEKLCFSKNPYWPMQQFLLNYSKKNYQYSKLPVKNMVLLLKQHISTRIVLKYQFAVLLLCGAIIAKIINEVYIFFRQYPLSNPPLVYPTTTVIRRFIYSPKAQNHVLKSAGIQMSNSVVRRLQFMQSNPKMNQLGLTLPLNRQRTIK